MDRQNFYCTGRAIKHICLVINPTETGERDGLDLDVHLLVAQRRVLIPINNLRQSSHLTTKGKWVLTHPVFTFVQGYILCKILWLLGERNGRWGKENKTLIFRGIKLIKGENSIKMG